MRATLATIGGPHGVALDASGNLYSTDSDNWRIRLVTASTGIITTIAGTGNATYNGDNILATSANLQCSTCLDKLGNLYIANSYNHRVRLVMKSTGVITTTADTGMGDYKEGNMKATLAFLSGPSGIMVDDFVRLYIVDTGSGRIRKVIPLTSPTSMPSAAPTSKPSAFSSDDETDENEPSSHLHGKPNSPPKKVTLSLSLKPNKNTIEHPTPFPTTDKRIKKATAKAAA